MHTAKAKGRSKRGKMAAWMIRCPILMARRNQMRLVQCSNGFVHLEQFLMTLLDKNEKDTLRGERGR